MYYKNFLVISIIKTVGGQGYNTGSVHTKSVATLASGNPLPPFLFLFLIKEATFYK